MALALVCGLLAGARVHGLVHAALVLGLLAATAGRHSASVLPLLLGLALCGAARGGAHAARLERARGQLDPAGVAVHLTGVVVEPPADASGEPVAIVRVVRGGTALPRGARLRLRLPEAAAVEWSDGVEGLAEIEPPGPRRNPGGFDARSFCAASDLAATGRIVWCARHPARGPAAWPRATFGRWRTAIERRLSRRLSPAARTIVVPLVLGDRSDMPPAFGAELRVAGLIHLIALSGLHVAWLAALARTLAGAAGAGMRARAAAGAASALLYVGIAGPIPSLARAAASELLGSMGRLGSRRVDPVQSLAVSAVVWLTLHPEWIHDLGFALSCTATLGLVTVGAAPPLLERLRGGAVQAPLAWLATRLATSVVANLWASLWASFGAQLLSLPILLAGFHLLPWVSPLANLLAVPIAGFLLSAAWLALLIDLAVPGAGAPWFHACDALSAVLRELTRWAACLPGAARGVAEQPAIVAVAALGSGLLAIACARRTPPAAEPRAATAGIPAAIVVGAALCAGALVGAAFGPELRPARGTWWLVTLDVGQGDASAIATADGWWLVDAGPRGTRSDAGMTSVLPFLRWAGVRRLQGLVITHDDADHWGGVASVLEGIDVRRIVVPAPRPGVPGPAARFRADTVSAGDILCASPRIVVRWPDRGPPRARSPGITADNAGSLVLEVGEGDGDGRAVLLADVDSTTEAGLTVAPWPAVLKVGHHGSGGSSGDRFLRRVSPLIAIISCGRRNRYGHPDAGALARLTSAGAAIERTDRSGAVWVALGPGGARPVDWRRSHAHCTEPGAPGTTCNVARATASPRAAP